MRILIIDDSEDIRLMLTKTLQKWGHEVIARENGAQALEFLKNDPVNFVISDWMMPVMDGLELCQRIRNSDIGRYIYVILLTAKDDKKELVAGMAAGADDFLVKPLNKDELKVRIRAGERILNLEKDLDERNQKLQNAYARITKDLEAAAKIQESLLPNTASVIRDIKFEWQFIPCTYIAGDILSFFPVNETYVGFYLLDVAGHGIPSAMLSVTLSKMLEQSTMQDSILKESIPKEPYYKILPPSQVLAMLNERFQNERDAMQYFTMVYGMIDVSTNKMTLSQAGHPFPLLIKKGQKIKPVGKGGYPVGMLPNLEYDEVELQFETGDRLFIYSDGITEATNSQNELFSDRRLMYYLNEYADIPLQNLLIKLKQHLCEWRGNEDFQDDVSILAMEKV